MHRTNYALVVSLALAACLSDPDKKECIEFEVDSEPTCGSGCDVYCDAVVGTCPGIYSSLGACMTECEDEPANPIIVDGFLTDLDIDSLACRFNYLRAGQCENVGLERSQTQQCLRASCKGYCDLMAQNCPGAYPTIGNCEQTCEMLNNPLDADPLEDADTVACRLRYALEAANDPGGDACDAASLNGGSVCGDNPCEPYCRLVMRNCTGDHEVYESTEECLRVCSFMEKDGRYDGWDFDLEEDTVQCRSYHAGPPAVQVPRVHCPHVRLYNDEHCTSVAGTQPDDWPCLTFCDIYERFCLNFPGLFECRQVCALFPEVKDFDPVEGPQLFPLTVEECPTL